MNSSSAPVHAACLPLGGTTRNRLVEEKDMAWGDDRRWRVSNTCHPVTAYDAVVDVQELRVVHWCAPATGVT